MSAEPVRIDVDLKLPIGTAGWVQMKIQCADIASVSAPDQRFLLDMIERLGRLSGRDVVPPAVPAILRGAGGRA